MRLNLATLALFLIAMSVGFVPALVEGYFDSATIDFWPAKANISQEITLEFTLAGAIEPGELVSFLMPSFSSGNCDNVEGETIPEDRFILWDNSKWFGSWVREGKASEAFGKSILQLRAKVSIPFRTAQTVIIDGQNHLKPCYGNEGSANLAASQQNFSVWTSSHDAWIKARDYAADYSIPDSTIGSRYNSRQPLDSHPAIAGSGYLTNVSLAWRELSAPILKDDGTVKYEGTQIIIRFTPGVALTPNAQITVKLPGFTTSSTPETQAAGSDEDDIILWDQHSFNLDPDSISYGLFEGDWKEGTFGTSIDGCFSDATLELTPKNYLPPGRNYEVIVHKDNGIKSLCAITPNSNRFMIKVDTGRSVTSVDWRYFDSVQSLGILCLNDCSGHGTCVSDTTCRAHCDCVEGFGVPHPYMPNDCSQRVCPKGLHPVGQPYLPNDPTETHDVHALLECSGVGECDRTAGICECPPGHYGRACEFIGCSHEEAEQCSGHGRCMSMQALSLTADAVPLTDESDDASIYNHATDGSTYEYATDVTHTFTPASASMNVDAYDALYHSACVCDSSWPLGLGSGEMQLPEWFGLDCSLRRCPSGDDPDTDKDETDCEGKKMPGSQGVGEAGNLCYVECSNRGICDHSTGLCECLEGYYGDNCDSRVP